jgi:drug/metabolite transporter (DMT)-like permease
MERGTMVIKGYGLIIVAAALWGMIGPLAKWAFQEGIAPMEVAFWRAVLAWGMFGLHAILERRCTIQRRDYATVLIFAVLGVSLFYGSYQWAVQKGGAALAAVLLYTAPAWVAVMSRIFFKEEMSPAKMAALLLTVGGVTGVSWGAGGSAASMHASLPAVLWGLTAGFCYSLYFIFGKYFSGRYSSPNLFLYILPVGALGLLPWVDFAPKSLSAWIALICLALFCTYGAYYVYYIGLKYLEATRAAIVATIEPVIAAMVAYLWWQESFTLIGYVGSSLVLGAVVLIVWDGARKRR